MQNPTIITCAVTGGADSTDKSPYVPITPQQIADQAIDAAKAGAAIVQPPWRVETRTSDLKLMDRPLEKRCLGRPGR